MRQTKANVILLLQAMHRNSLDVARHVESNRPDVASDMRNEAEGLQHAIWLLTDSNYFNRMVEIYHDDLEQDANDPE